MEERAWYVVQTYSGCENAAKKNIERRIESMGMSDKIFRVLVPEQKVVERKKNGELKEVMVKPFMGYDTPQLQSCIGDMVEKNIGFGMN